MNVTTSKGMKDFGDRFRADMERRFPTVSKGIQSFSIGRNKDESVGNANFKLSPAMMQSGVYMACDSRVAPYVANPRFTGLVVDENPAIQAHIERTMDSLISAGVSEDKARERVKKSFDTYLYFDMASKQYHVTPVVKGINDSLLSGQAVPHWNIGYLNKVFKQPYAKSFAKHLVSVEGFGNPWADVLSVFKEEFEGFGRISNVAKGTVETNNSDPVTNAMGLISTDVINIAVDYETGIEEKLRAGQPGNILGGMAIIDREKYANMVLERAHDALIIFGNQDTGTEGLLDVGGVTTYGGTPLNDIVEGASTTKGALIVQALNEVIYEYLRENLFMPTEIRISCSTYVMKALTATTYSDTMNPDSPIQTIRGNFDAKQSVGGGVQSCAWTLVCDPMLDPSNDFNDEDDDLFIITTPSVDSALEEQHGLVIAPEPLKRFILPAIYQRSGLLYTMYKRVGGIIAPVENTVKVIRGFGYQGA